MDVRSVNPITVSLVSGMNMVRVRRSKVVGHTDETSPTVTLISITLLVYLLT